MQSSNNFSADGSAGLAALAASSSATEGRRRRFVRIVAVVVSLSVVILGIGLVRHGVDGAAYAKDAPLPVTSPAPIAPAPLAAAAAPAPTPALAPTTGTVVRGSKKRLLVDGALVRAPSLSVTCGAHTVKVGASKPRTIDVPCGGEITLR